MMKFCFPERESENIDYSDRVSEDGENEPKKRSKGKKRDSNFYVHIDDVEKMKVVECLCYKTSDYLFLLLGKS